MSKWNAIQRVKCKVGDMEYRDYTPAFWNINKNYFSLYIEAGHDGAGARWVKKLRTGDEILLSAVYAARLPAQEGKILGIGDGSALGHMLALKLLTDRQKYPIEVAIAFHESYLYPTVLRRENPEFDFLFEEGHNSLQSLTDWLSVKELKNYTSIYIAGNIPMTQALRKYVTATTAKAKIYTYGFWR